LACGAFWREPPTIWRLSRRKPTAANAKAR
jgi:hypothetical protein